MATLAYHASHEQFTPSRLLRLAQMAESAGFDAIHASDHFHPWSARQGNSAFTFSWIGAALQACSVPFSMVCAPGQRYHPAIVAQALATLCEMFPGRLNVELGSGEALNELITGQPWPPKQIRNERLLECATVIRKLLKGEEVTYHGHVNVKEAKLYTLPLEQPLLFCAAISEDTSAWAGGWADGLLTTAGSYEDTVQKRDAFYQKGGQGKPFYVQFSFSYHPERSLALQGAYEQWRSNLLPKDKLADLYKTQQFDDATEDMPLSEVADQIIVITSINELQSRIREYERAGADRIVLHNVNTWQEEFISDFGKWTAANGKLL